MITPDKGLQILNEALDISSSSMPIEEKLKGMTNLLARGLGIDDCRIYVLQKDRHTLFLQSVNDEGPQGPGVQVRRVGEGIVGICASEARSIVVPDSLEMELGPLYLRDEPSSPASAAVFPMSDGDITSGVIYLGSRNRMVFEKRETIFLSAISRIAASMLRESIAQREMHRRVRELSIMHDIGTAVMSTIKLDRLLHVILTAVTMGDGLGFNRAMLFLYNDRSNIIQGMMGVGPDSEEEAWRIWGEYATKKEGVLDVVSRVREGGIPTSRLNDIVRTIRLQIDAPCVVARTVREQSSFNVKRGEDWAEINAELVEKLEMTTFASVPLMSSGKVVGVIVVDNIYNRKEITEDDMRFLSMFASQAGLAIENSLLYSDVNKSHLELKETHEKLLQSEKLAALGEMAANVAHEIRNPLTTLGGFAKRLAKKLDTGDEKRYAEVIYNEVSRLERLLTDILLIPKKGESGFRKEDINEILESVASQISDEAAGKKIVLSRCFSPDLPRVSCDCQQIKQVFINLVSNAIQAISSDGTITISSYKKKEENGLEWVAVSVADTGGGIPEKLVPNIFNPFFTTKDTGTGLGLSISHRIIIHHQGEIEVENNPGEGATFIVKLPIRYPEKEREEGV